MICNWSLLKDISFNTKCLLVLVWLTSNHMFGLSKFWYKFSKFLKLSSQTCDFYNPVQKILENLHKLRKSCNRKQNIKTLIREFRWKEMKSSNYSIVPSLLAKIQFYSYLAENSQKATLNFYFKSRFSVKPIKFPIYFAQDCSTNWLGLHIIWHRKVLDLILCHLLLKIVLFY